VECGITGYLSIHLTFLRKLLELSLMSLVNKGTENITSSLFIKGTNKPSKETEWKFLNYIWKNMRTQENTNQYKNFNPTSTCAKGAT
jgi:hypothetical protein